MSAKASGASAQPNGSAHNRHQHHDGSADRAFTSEQKDAVIRVRKCSPTAFYDILGLESERATVTDGGIKKAYRKLSLLTHPDKNAYKGADEAFKLVSRAFQILSDPDKKSKYDKFGGDPDNRFSSSSASASPFSGFARSPRAASGTGGGSMFEEEMTPEELFRQFFGGGVGGGFGGGPFGGGLFDASPGGGFAFNMGGGPGVRVHQFAGGRPRRRPPGAAQNQPEQRPSAGATLANLLPLLIFLVIPLLSSLFSGAGSFFDSTSSPKLPAFSVDVPRPPDLTQPRTSPMHGVTYYVNPSDVAEWGTAHSGPGKRKWKDLDNAAERRLIFDLDNRCRREELERQALLQEAQGWFFVDQEKYNEASSMEMAACKRRVRLFGGWR